MAKRNAGQQVELLLKSVYADGEVNAARIWKGFDVSTGRTGWHLQWFGRNEVQYLGNSISEVAEYVDATASSREDA